MPDSGAVLIDGQNILGVPSARRGMGVVFQNYALFPHLSGWNNIAFGMKIAGRSNSDIKRRVPELLELVGLGDAGNQYPHQMSGGQQQRIALARALAIEPRMLLLDEPLSALDAVVRVGLRDEIRRIQSKLGITTLYVTHDQEEALAISDRIVVMRNGKIEQIGNAEDIYSKPASSFVAGFIGKMNQIRGAVIDAAQGVVQCGRHRLRVPMEQSVELSNGRAVTVLVRPENIVVSPNASHKDRRAVGNQMIARAGLVTFLGSVKRVEFDAEGSYLIADIPASGETVRRGDIALLSFPEDACQLLPNHQADGNAEAASCI